MANYKAYGTDMSGADANLNQADAPLGVTLDSSGENPMTAGKPVSRVGNLGLNAGIQASGTAKFVVDVDEVRAAIAAVGGTYAAGDTIDLMTLTGDQVVVAGWLFPQGGGANVAGTVTVGTATDDDRFVTATPLNTRRQPVAFTAGTSGVPNVIVAAGDTLRVKFAGTATQLTGAKFVVAVTVVDMSDDDSFATGAV